MAGRANCFVIGGFLVAGRDKLVCDRWFFAAGVDNLVHDIRREQYPLVWMLPEGVSALSRTILS